MTKKRKLRAAGNGKKQAQKKHAVTRAAERYGIEFSQALRDACVNLIRNQKAVLVREQSNRVRIYEVELAGASCRVVYDRQRREIVTFLPRDGGSGDDQ